jgi:hypothetical protein
MTEHQAPAALEVGQPFNPFGLFTGIFVPDALVRSTAISAGAKLTYGRLARYAGQDGNCYPAVPTLASEIGMSVANHPQSPPANVEGIWLRRRQPDPTLRIRLSRPQTIDPALRAFLP